MLTKFCWIPYFAFSSALNKYNTRNETATAINLLKNLPFENHHMKAVEQVCSVDFLQNSPEFAPLHQQQ